MTRSGGRWWRRQSLRTRLTLIAATAIAVSVFLAFQVASELMDQKLQDTAESQLRADSHVLATDAERAGVAQVVPAEIAAVRGSAGRVPDLAERRGGHVLALLGREQ